jgi:hypothetical protein
MYSFFENDAKGSFLLVASLGKSVPSGRARFTSRRQTNSAHDRHSLHFCNWRRCACSPIQQSYPVAPFLLVGVVPLVVVFVGQFA